MLVRRQLFGLFKHAHDDPFQLFNAKVLFGQDGQLSGALETWKVLLRMGCCLLPNGLSNMPTHAKGEIPGLPSRKAILISSSTPGDVVAAPSSPGLAARNDHHRTDPGNHLFAMPGEGCCPLTRGCVAKDRADQTTLSRLSA